MYPVPQVSPVSEFPTTRPRSVAEAYWLLVFHLYPIALAAGFQFQVIEVRDGVCVEATGVEGLLPVVAVNGVTTEIPHG